MGDILPIFILLLVVIPTIISFNQAKKQSQNQQQTKKQQPPQNQPKPASVLPPRERQPLRPTLQPTLHNHSGMFDGSLFADNGTEGSDPHDHGFDHEVDMPRCHSADAINQSLKGQTSQNAPAKRLVLDFSPDNIASAFVLQEVLKRK